MIIQIDIKTDDIQIQTNKRQTDRWTNRLTDRRIVEQIDRHSYERMNGQVDRQSDIQKIDRWTDRQTDKAGPLLYA